MSIDRDKMYKSAALRAVTKAGKILREEFHKKKKISVKKDLSLVTAADLKADRIIRKIITTNFPSHHILSEESGGKVGKEYTWVVDPLDGTSNFVRGIPIFSVSLALLYQKKPILAAVFNPILDELYLAEKGKGATLNGKPIRVNKTKNPREAVILFNKGRGIKNFLSWISLLRKIGKDIKSVRALGSSNLEICKVASGNFEGYINFGSNPWDLIPGSFIVEEAKGKTTDIRGGVFRIGVKSLFASNAYIHKAVLYLINKK